MKSKLSTKEIHERSRIYCHHREFFFFIPVIVTMALVILFSCFIIIQPFEAASAFSLTVAFLIIDAVYAFLVYISLRNMFMVQCAISWDSIYFRGYFIGWREYYIEDIVEVSYYSTKNATDSLLVKFSNGKKVHIPSNYVNFANFKQAFSISLNENGIRI